MPQIFKKFPELLLGPIAFVLFLFTRLYNILSLPIFTDEAIYIRWSQIARLDSNWRFISLTDGKQPGFVWADILFMKVFDDPLLAGRLVSVAFGLLILVGLYFLSYEVFKKIGNKKARIMGLTAALLYALFPFGVVYDRLALYESMIAAFFVWSLYFQIILARTLRLDIAMIAGFVIGGGVLTKSSAFLSIYMMPFLLLLVNFSKKTLRGTLLKVVVLFGVTALIANVMYAVLRLSPFFHIVEQKNANFVYPVSEWMKFEFADKISNFISNFNGLWDWFFIYFSFPYILLVITSFFISTKFIKEKALLVLWFVLPFLALGVFGRTLYPRYVFFMALPLLPLVSYSLILLFERFRNIFVRFLILIVILFLPIRMIYFVLTDIAHAPIPRLDLEQFINGWPAGGGVKQSTQFFEEQSQKGPIFIGTQGTFGLLPSSYEIFLYSNKNITVKGYWPTDEKMPEELLAEAKKNPTYVVFYQDCSNCEFPGDAPDTWPLKIIQSYNKGIGPTKLTVYQVIAPQE